MKSKARLFAPLCFLLVSATSASAANYCMAIRGNGEIEPAHWGAVANVVERLGLPQAQAGGSSASITMLLLDAIATNEFVKEGLGAAQRERAALLIKSLQGFLNNLTTTNQWRDFANLYKRSQELKNPKWARDMDSILTYASKLKIADAQGMIAENKALLLSNYKTGMQLGLISQKSYAPLFEAVERLTAEGKHDPEAFARDLAVAKFYAGELYSALSVFGAFNAQTDDNIFFRPGIVDFDRLALQFGRVASFYAMLDLQPEEDSQWRKFLSVCTKPAVGKTWDDLVAAVPECATLLNQTINTHFATASGNFAEKEIGVTIPSFPATAVLTGTAHEDAQTAKAAYAANLDPHFGKTFKLRNPEELKFGYWGKDFLLSRIEANRDRSDEKSARFMSLGQATWAKVLGLSPAEPGLSPLKTFKVSDTTVTSAGGWPDLHPVLLLRAAGCENVVYVTRRGGESLFGQGVAKRLLGYDRDWNLISTSSPEAKKASAKLNNNGDPTDMKSLWARLYNLANPLSSMKRALKSADAVLCTDWDKFEIKNGVVEMIADSYKSPYFVSPTGGLIEENLSPVLNTSEMSEDGFPTFAGCY